MNAFHTNWTRPFAARNPGAPYEVAPFELLTTILSALEWRAAGGVISMITDRCGAAYYEARGLSSLWNGGVHARLEGAIPESVSPLVFWAAGKLYALQTMPAPCVMLDTDFIVWRDIAPLCENAEVAVIHFEDLDPRVYPDPAGFRLSSGFDLAPLDCAVRPCNTALTYFAAEGFKSRYVRRAISFMEHAPQADDTLTYMVFAEQRLLSMCAAEDGVAVRALSDLPTLFGAEQAYFTHIWGFKQRLVEEPAVCDAFCRRCAARIVRDFSEFAPQAARIPALQGYF